MSDHDSDGGSVAVVALVVILLGGITVAALTSFSVAVIKAHTSQSARIVLERTADGALQVAASILRTSQSDTVRDCADSSMIVDGALVGIECTQRGSTSPVRAGLVTTLNSSTISSQTLPPWAGDLSQAIRGAVVINTGTLTSPSVAVLPDRRLDSSATWSTRATSWASFASSGDLSDPGEYPPLPPIPLFERPGSQTSVGTCSVYFPGRYLGTSSLILSGGLHYFASGAYYFERTLVVSNGARVVMGEGSNPGCSNDVEAMSTGRSPQQHAISGTGATLLLGGAARVVVQDASLMINARNGGSEPSIRTVTFGSSTSTISAPEDLVRLDNGSTVAVSTHTNLPPESSTPLAYKASTLSPATAIAVSVTLNGTQPATNGFVADGQIFVPFGGVHLASTTSAYRVSITGGIVTARLTTALPNAPSGSGAAFDVGSTLPPATSANLTLDARAVGDGRSFESQAVFDVSNSMWSLVGRTRRFVRTSPP